MENFERENYKASLHEYKDFVEGNIWSDIQTVLRERIENYHVMLEEATAEELPRIQGAISELRFLLYLPQGTIAKMKEEQEYGLRRT